MLGIIGVFILFVVFLFVFTWELEEDYQAKIMTTGMIEVLNLYNNFRIDLK